MAGRGALKYSAKSGLYLNDRGEKHVIESKFQYVCQSVLQRVLTPCKPFIIQN